MFKLQASKPIQKALGWSILQSVYKLGGLYSVGKLMALWFGPAGLALIGQFQNLLYLQQNAGGAAVHNALIQGMSQQKAEGRDEESYLRKGLALGMILSLGVALLWWALLPWLLDPVLGGDFPLWLASRTSEGTLTEKFDKFRPKYPFLKRPS
jgi:PST family polysaccharide transporter